MVGITISNARWVPGCAGMTCILFYFLSFIYINPLSTEMAVDGRQLAPVDTANLTRSNPALLVSRFIKMFCNGPTKISAS